MYVGIFRLGLFRVPCKGVKVGLSTRLRRSVVVSDSVPMVCFCLDFWSAARLSIRGCTFRRGYF